MNITHIAISANAKRGSKHPKAKSPQPRFRFIKFSDMSLAKQMFSGGNGIPVRTSTPTAFGKVNFNLFFDRTQVLRGFDAKEWKVLSRTGAWTRGGMRRSIRKGGKKGKPAAVGKPPKYWTRGFASLKDGIFFQASLEGGNVVIGPNKLKTQVTPAGRLASSAQLLEEGGHGIITSYRHNKSSKSGKVRPPRQTQRRGEWQERPYAEPMQKPAEAKLVELIRTTPI